MEILLYLLTLGALFGFGYFLANDNIGQVWSILAIIGMIITVSAFTSYIEQGSDQLATSHSTQFAYSVLRLTTFALGYLVGYPRKRKHWKATALVNLSCIVVLALYLILT